MPVVKNLMVRAGADFSAITKQANKAKASMSGMQTSVSASCSRMSASVANLNKVFKAVGVSLSLTAVAAFSKQAKAAYDEQTEASTKLAQAMKNTMGAREAEVQEIEELIDAQERLGIVDGAVQTAAAQELATYLTLGKSLKALIPVMNDMVAQQYGLGASAESAVSIATMMGKVMNGSTSALSRYGYSFTEAQEAILKYGDEAQRAAVLAEVVSQSVGGMNAALAATPDGRMQQLNFHLGRAQETFGQAVNTVAVLFIPALSKACDLLSGVASYANRAAQAIANVFGKASSNVPAVAVPTAAADAMDGLTDSAKAAGETAKEAMSLMGFDTLQRLPSAEGSSDIADVPELNAASALLPFTDSTEEASQSIGWLEAALSRLKTMGENWNLDSLAQSLGRLQEAAAPLTQGLFSGLHWGYENVLVPLAAWSGAHIVSSLESISGFLEKTCDLLSGSTSLGEFLSSLTPAETALAGIATSLGAIAVISAGMAGLTTITTFFKSIQSLNAVGTIGKLAEVFLIASSGAGTLSEAIRLVFGPGSIIAGTAATIGGAVLAVTNFAAMLKNGFSWANEALMLLGVALAGVGAVILGAPALVAGVVAGVVASVATAAVVIKENWASIKQWFCDAWTGIKQFCSDAGSWFKNNVCSPIVNGFKWSINSNISAFEGFVNAGISGLNLLIKAFNKLSFDIPDWIPLIGGKSWGFNIPTIRSVSLPRLATGAVIPPNNEFAAILGDQRSGMNIETPERLLRSIFREENDSSAVLDVLEKILSAVEAGKILAVDKKVLARVLQKELSGYARSHGTAGIPI